MNRDAPRGDLAGVHLPPVGCDSGRLTKILYGKFKSNDALEVSSRPPETLVIQAIASYTRGQDMTKKPTGVYIKNMGSFDIANLRVLRRYCDIAKILKEVKAEERWLTEDLHGAPTELVETARKHLLGCCSDCTVLSMRNLGVLKVEALACLPLEQYLNEQVIDTCLRLAEKDANSKNRGTRQVACLTVPECDNLYKAVNSSVALNRLRTAIHAFSARMDIEHLEQILMPVHMDGCHRGLLQIIIQECTIRFGDGLTWRMPQYLVPAAKLLLQVLNEVHPLRNKETNKCLLTYKRFAMPQQPTRGYHGTNGCGVAVILAAQDFCNMGTNPNFNWNLHNSPIHRANILKGLVNKGKARGQQTCIHMNKRTVE